MPGRECGGDEQKAAEGKLAPFRAYGKSKDHRDDLPQVVIGMAFTRDGIPVRVWCWPGNTSDSALIRQVKDDMRGAFAPFAGSVSVAPRRRLEASWSGAGAGRVR